ncbi:Serum paraoxonase/arylesterase 1 [Podila epigama]|nr:Serum paraoxonase/arylesterase 1 [Podila epigama]
MADSKKVATATTKTTTTTTTTTTTKTRTKTKTSSHGSCLEVVTGGVVVLAVLLALSFSFVKNAVNDLGLLLPPIVSLNTEGCQIVPGLEACEDIHIHYPSGLAFATCGHAQSRKDWFPPMNKLNASAEPVAFQNNIVLYDIDASQYKILELQGLPEGTDRVFHGLDIYEVSPTELLLFAVNHRRGGSAIEVLEYRVGSDTIQHLETIRHELIRTPNDIVAVGPRSFYVSNDHLHTHGPMRTFEDFMRRPWTNVIYYSPEETFVAFKDVVTANGMTANADRSVFYLSACHGAAVHVLRPRADKTLEQEEYIKLDFFVDNPSYDPQTGDVFIAGHVQPMQLANGLKKKKELPVVGPSKVIKLSKRDITKGEEKSASSLSSYKVETVLEDDGHFISTSTVAAVDRTRQVMLVAAVFSEQGFFRCPIPAGL